MKFGSVCSGIEAASVAWESLGFEAQWFSEIEHFPSEVLKYRYPTVPNLGDMTKLTENETFKASSIDILVGGTPCQSFSVAGLRRGLADPRGNLMLTFLALADAKKPRWIVWENVPGVLSSNGGRDFGTFLGALGELRYGFAYRVLDAQYVGGAGAVPQRRRRVFVVGYLGDWRPAAAVLFERESLSRDFKSSRKKGQETSTDAQRGVGATSPDGRETIGTLRARDYKGVGNDDLESGRGLAIEVKQVAHPVHAFKVRGGCEGGGKGYLGEDEKAFTISTMQDQQIAQPITMEKIAGPIDASYYKGQGSRQGGEREFVAQPIPIHDQATRFQGKRGDKQDGKGNGLGIGNEGDVMNTLTKADKHAVAQPIAFQPGNLARDAGAEPSTKTFPTLRANLGDQSPHVAQPIAVDVYNQTIDGQTSATLTKAVGGTNTSGPKIAQPISIAENTIGRQPMNGGNGDGFTEDGPMYTLNATGVHGVAQPIAYSFDSLASNSMKSSNPHSGCRKVETSKTIDTTIPEPSKNQGGIAIAQPKYFESHPNDSRVTGPHDIGNTVSARYGTGGGNTPLVSQPFRKVRRAQSETDFETWERDEKANTLNCFDQGDVRSTNVIAQPIAVDWRTAQVDVEMTGTLKTDLAKMSGPCIAVDCYNQTINENTSQTIGSSASDVNHYGAVLEPTIIDRAAFNQGENAQYEPRIEEGQTMSSLVAKGPHAVAGFLPTQGSKAQGIGYAEEQAPTLRAGCDNYGVMHTMAIRRLTPKECERLQGFPDDWTKIPYRNKPADQCPDGPRYKACGNSMAVPVMRWIGQRIQLIDTILNG